MEITNRIGIHNRFDIEVVDSLTGEVKQKAQAFNVICDNLWNRLISYTTSSSSSEGYGYSAYIHFGKGTGTPSHTDTSLFNSIGSKPVGTTNYTINQDIIHGVASCRRSILLDETEYNGETITEVGFGYAASNTSLCTHAMLQDMNGNPISITKTSTDIITIYGTVYVHFDQSSDVKIMSLAMAMHNRYNESECSMAALLFGIKRLSNASSGSGYLIPGRAYLVKPWFTRIDKVDNSDSVHMGFMYSDMGNFQYDKPNKKIVVNYSRLPATMSSGGNNPYMNWSGAHGIILANVNYSSSYSYGNPRGQHLAYIECGKDTIPPFQITNESVSTGDGSTTKFHTKFDMPYDAVVKVNGSPITNGVVVKKLPVNLKGSYLCPYCRNVLIMESGDVIPQDSTQGSSIVHLNSWSSLQFQIPKTNDGFVCENTVNEIGINGLYNFGASRRIQISDDGVDWSDIEYGTPLTEEQKHARFWRDNTTDTSYAGLSFDNSSLYDGNNIIFDTPPASGDVITIDYKTPTIPKDADHVFDLTVTFQFGEYTPPNEGGDT